MEEKVKSCYIHIPFCNYICSYCDFCKVYYNKKFIKKYLKSLEIEINEFYKNEVLETLYIGGGTPSSLDVDELKYLFRILNKFNLSKNIEFTFECNIDITYEKLKVLYENKVNRISIGIQSVNEKNLKFLNRNHTKEEVIEKINLIKKIGFKNINVDLIYAIPNETLDDLKCDLDFLTSLDINHISTYSLMIEPNTKLYIDNVSNIDEDLDYKMYQYICNYLKNKNFNHYETSNFSKNCNSIHNLTYWNNNHYYGFGVGASGYIDNIRYTNTRNLNKYLNNIYDRQIEIIDEKINMQNEMILGLRKVDGVSLLKFKSKYNKEIEDVFNIKKLLDDKKLIIENNFIKINPKYFYIQNQILREFI